jgi:hypothetical protein
LPIVGQTFDASPGRSLGPCHDSLFLGAQHVRDQVLLPEVVQLLIRKRRSCLRKPELALYVEEGLPVQTEVSTDFVDVGFIPCVPAPDLTQARPIQNKRTAVRRQGEDIHIPSAVVDITLSLKPPIGRPVFKRLRQLGGVFRWRWTVADPVLKPTLARRVWS